MTVGVGGVRSVDQSDGLRIKAVPQPRGPACHTAVWLSRGHEGERPVSRLGGVFDDAAGSTMVSSVTDVRQRWEGFGERCSPLSAGIRMPWGCRSHSN